jgi:23S rRNA (pseudouridine1915-N3)-methyltransferase
MKIKLLTLGKTADEWAKDGIAVFEKRLKHYCTFNIEEYVVPGLKGLNQEQQKTAEGKFILEKISSGERIILLDENGSGMSSEKFAEWIGKQQNSGVKTIVFVVGGPFGFSDEVYKAAAAKISLSSMTFTHQMVRLFFTEQLYRAFTILKGEKYHHA